MAVKGIPLKNVRPKDSIPHWGVASLDYLASTNAERLTTKVIFDQTNGHLFFRRQSNNQTAKGPGLDHREL